MIHAYIFSTQRGEILSTHNGHFHHELLRLVGKPLRPNRQINISAKVLKRVYEACGYQWHETLTKERYYYYYVKATKTS